MKAHRTRRDGAWTRAGIALGANLGNAEASVRDAIDWLDVGAPETRLVRASRLRRTAPWGRIDQPEFVNAVAIVETRLSPRALLNALLGKETSAGRVRAEKWGPRTLDLDLLWWGDAVVDEPGLTLPHPGIAVRTFVLEPLAEVARDWAHPGTGRTAAQMLAALGAPR